MMNPGSPDRLDSSFAITRFDGIDDNPIHPGLRVVGSTAEGYRKMHKALAIILAGGKGTRLEPLTRDRAKPGVPFGGQYRIIDFVLSNCINSGLRKILVLTQYKAASLDRHINKGWRFLSRELGEYIDVIPPQQRVGEQWYMGTADAIYQNIYSIEQEAPDYTLILSGDHIYRMDYRPMIQQHFERRADLTIASLPVPIDEARSFGVLEVDDSSRVVSFHEKPARPNPLPQRPDLALASMGIYVFNTSVMFERLCQDAIRPNSSHDFGKDIIPAMIKDARVYTYAFNDERTGEAAYWRDVGTLDSYYQTSMDLLAPRPHLDLHDEAWPFFTSQTHAAPPKFISSDRGDNGRAPRGQAVDSMVCPGCVVDGGHVERSILARRVLVERYSIIEDSIIQENVKIGEHCRIRRAIIDKDNVIPAGTHIGYDLAFDRRRGFTITDQGLVVVPKGESEEAFLGDVNRRRVS
jgi:glucose-1-phosphate adenylyltransferase